MSERRGGESKLFRTDRPSGLSAADAGPSWPKRRSSPRMSSFDYIGPFAYSVTISTRRDHRAFVDSDTVSLCLTALADACTRHGFEILAYCFMPDHLHLLLQGSEGSSLIEFMKRFKQLSSFRYKQRTGEGLWHRSFHDRVLRSEDELERTALYIWDNPVAAGLADDLAAYPHSGPRELMMDRPEGLSVRRGEEQPIADGSSRPSLRRSPVPRMADRPEGLSVPSLGKGKRA